MIYDRKQLSLLLNITKDNLVKLEKRNTLDKRLKSIGLKLIKVAKESKTYYYVENTTIGIDKSLRIRKEENFLEYFNIRSKEKPTSIKDIAVKSKVNKNTIVKWDKKLMDNRVMSKDGFYYFKLDIGENEIIEISKDEYSSYWRNANYVKALKRLQDRYINGDITLNELQLASANIGGYYSIINGFYCFKVNKYKMDKNNTIYIDLSKLIGGDT